MHTLMWDIQIEGFCQLQMRLGIYLLFLGFSIHLELEDLEWPGILHEARTLIHSSLLCIKYYKIVKMFCINKLLSSTSEVCEAPRRGAARSASANWTVKIRRALLFLAMSERRLFNLIGTIKKIFVVGARLGFVDCAVVDFFVDCARFDFFC